jgi:hypothetical protein
MTFFYFIYVYLSKSHLSGRQATYISKSGAGGFFFDRANFGGQMSYLLRLFNKGV